MGDEAKKDMVSKSSKDDIQNFLEQMTNLPRRQAPASKGRLLFGMDATASREASWDIACRLQGDMFAEAATVGRLDVQLVYYRGYNEFRASRWHSSAADLIPLMGKVQCRGGHTQLRRMLSYATKETRVERINAFVFVGDALEEDIDAVCAVAGELGMLGVPCFMFQEGENPEVTNVFKQIAQLTKGAYCAFDSSSASQLRQLLNAVAVYAAGGRAALEDYGRREGEQVMQIAHQMKS